MLAASEELILDCGDGVRLQAFRARPPGATRSALLLHGWEGSADSYYVVSLATRLYAAGVEVVRLNLRDHGQTHHLNPGIFHSCRLDEVCGAVGALAPQLVARAPWLLGFSLGGNFWLRVAASGDRRVPPLGGVVAISPVLHPDSAMLAMERGWQVYQRHFVRKWARSLLRKRTLWPELQLDEEFFRLGDLRRMTDALVAGHTGFADTSAYLDGYAVTGDRLATLSAPTTILAALDDPIIPAEDLARLAPSPLLKIITVPYGGHMGFMVHPWAETWVNGFVLQEMGLA